jgi:hypothetical protein
MCYIYYISRMISVCVSTDFLSSFFPNLVGQRTYVHRFPSCDHIQHQVKSLFFISKFLSLMKVPFYLEKAKGPHVPLNLLSPLRITEVSHFLLRTLRLAIGLTFRADENITSCAHKQILNI